MASMLGIMITGCEKQKEFVYVDSNTGIEIEHPLNVFKTEVVCNEFGMAYYKQTNEHNNEHNNELSYTYTPVIVSYYKKGNETDKANAPFISCEDYQALIKK